jgi:hypothetical protein
LLRSDLGTLVQLVFCWIEVEIVYQIIARR